jgi:hypothetical protein
LVDFFSCVHVDWNVLRELSLGHGGGSFLVLTHPRTEEKITLDRPLILACGYSNTTLGRLVVTAAIHLRYPLPMLEHTDSK